MHKIAKMGLLTNPLKRAKIIKLLVNSSIFKGTIWQTLAERTSLSELLSLRFVHLFGALHLSHKVM